MSEWQAIETAPKDGRWVLIYGGKAVHDTHDGLSDRFECDINCVILAFMNLSGIWEGDADNWTYTPTHWMPLPPPPKAGGEGK